MWWMFILVSYISANGRRSYRYLTVIRPDDAQPLKPYTITLTYDPANLPAGVQATDLGLYYYDEDAAQWVSVTSDVGETAHTVTASPQRFGRFGILAEVDTMDTAVQSVYLPMVVK
jgi:hypothetical protein